MGFTSRQVKPLWSFTYVYVRMLTQIRFTLIETSHPGNIGGVARAMKCMGLLNLTLVKPKYFPHPDATSRATGAEDVLARARVSEDIEQAIDDSVFVVGTTSRARSIEWPVVAPRTAAERIIKESRQGPVSILFGRERSGLTNREVDLCHLLMRIPTSQKYTSLNLASAAQIMAYELYLTANPVPVAVTGNNKADSESMSRFYLHLEETLHDLDFIKVKPPTKLMRKLVRLFNRAQPSIEEINILRGILSAAQSKKQVKG